MKYFGIQRMRLVTIIYLNKYQAIPATTIVIATRLFSCAGVGVYFFLGNSGVGGGEYFIVGVVGA